MSRLQGATSSPTKQMAQILGAVAEVGGHIIAWADDWEVSGATDPKTRPGLGPWLCDQQGPYDGLAASAVDRIGRNQVDTLVTAYANKNAGRHLVTADHPGLWDLDDSNQEVEFSIKSLGAQMEHRSIRKRNQDESKRAREAGQVAHRPSYGYRHVRPSPTQKVTHTELDPDSAQNAREVARRVLADTTRKTTPDSEAARLTRAGVLNPADRMAVLYGREPQGLPWHGSSLRKILISEAALGYLMVGGKPHIGPDGRPVKVAPELWDRPTHEALKKRLTPQPTGKPRKERAARGERMQSGIAVCGNCRAKMLCTGSAMVGGVRVPAFQCTARTRGLPGSEHCKPAPSAAIVTLDALTRAWFLGRFGEGQVMRRVFDAGSGFAAQIAELKANRTRLQADRTAGLYDAADQEEWFRQQYAQLTAEIAELEQQPERPAGWRKVPTGQTIADEWHAAKDDAERRGMLEEHGVRVVVHPWRKGLKLADRVEFTADVADRPATKRTSLRLAEPEPAAAPVGDLPGPPAVPEAQRPDAPSGAAVAA
ncbi:recombinase family protein [Kitasatospora sp. P5_F3]